MGILLNYFNNTEKKALNIYLLSQISFLYLMLIILVMKDKTRYYYKTTNISTIYYYLSIDYTSKAKLLKFSSSLLNISFSVSLST